MATTAAGAEVAMPTIVSWATPMASGSSFEGAGGRVSVTALADGSVMILLICRPRHQPFPRAIGEARSDHNGRFRRRPERFRQEENSPRNGEDYSLPADCGSLRGPVAS